MAIKEYPTLPIPPVKGQFGKSLVTNGTNISWGGGINWTLRLPGSTSTATSFRTIAYNGTNLYVAAGSLGVLFTSPDGITWTSRTSGFGVNDIRKVIFANGIWVAVGAAGVITTSYDGITWTARTANMGTNQINDVHYAAGSFVAVGDGGGATNSGGVIYSGDGTTWTRVSMTPAIGTSYYSVVYNGVYWVVGASQSTNNMLIALTPNGTYTALSYHTTQAVQHLYFDGTRTLASVNAIWTYSTSTSMANSTALSSIPQVGSTTFNPTYYYNGRIYSHSIAVGDFSTTPVNTNFSLNRSVNSISPLTTIGLAGVNGVIFAGPAGLIVGGNNYEIWTSF